MTFADLMNDPARAFKGLSPEEWERIIARAKVMTPAEAETINRQVKEWADDAWKRLAAMVEAAEK